ncbi:acyltransferase family protein [Chryseobacterium sp. 3008163]|uniref:acyltransferase family protein n=1 Tax=Chryseobacterium sp. 3008163 TaxID=2478663 RepID=UPI000F0C49ED|nr:acyltransferase family protein [Chryseobacterium sp. 3008163]AYN00514.1 acyltransferase [Chryseobacterium sp. 3008163]
MKLHNLQILRGISALFVCCFHIREGLIFGDVKFGEILFGRGSIGVPIFFVISGFIMVFTTKKIKFDENTTKEIISFFKKESSELFHYITCSHLPGLSWEEVFYTILKDLD